MVEVRLAELQKQIKTWYEDGYDYSIKLELIY